jgi:microsomal dipeptidase-like Zn-dependent dipeptidase
MEKIPVIDLHCDLTSYLAEVPGAHHANTHDIGCATPLLAEGHVKVQVLAVYTSTAPGSTAFSGRQVAIYEQLLRDPAFRPVHTPRQAQEALGGEAIGIVLAIENASGLCEEGEPLRQAFRRFDDYAARAGRIAYIGFTHHLENRFGGGNKTTVGLKPDGMAMLDFLHGRGVAIDLSHTSDALALGVLDYLERQRLDVPIMASHSNFREIWDHVRNLPSEVTQEIVRRGGLIGMNFLREYVDRNRPEALEDHILHGLEAGPDSMAFGADYFYVKDFADASRLPFYFSDHEDARAYPPLLANLANRGVSSQQLAQLSWGNALRFFQETWR